MSASVRLGRYSTITQKHIHTKKHINYGLNSRRSTLVNYSSKKRLVWLCDCVKIVLKRWCPRLPLSCEFSKVAEEDDRRLEMTGSVCLDRFIVETDLLSASTNTQAQNTTSDAKLNTTSMRNTENALRKGLKIETGEEGKSGFTFLLCVCLQQLMDDNFLS